MNFFNIFSKKKKENEISATDFAEGIVEFGNNYPADMTRLCEAWFKSPVYYDYCKNIGVQPSIIKDNNIDIPIARANLYKDNKKVFWVPHQNMYFIVTDQAIIFSYRLYSSMENVIRHCKRMAESEISKNDMMRDPNFLEVDGDRFKMMMPNFMYENQIDENNNIKQLKVTFGYEETEKSTLLYISPLNSCSEEFSITRNNNLFAISGNEYKRLRQILRYTDFLEEGKYVCQESSDAGLYICNKVPTDHDVNSPVFYIK